MTGKDYEGTVGNRDHITRGESGALPIDAVRNMHGARGEVPGEHRNRQGQAWEDFKADIAANGIKEPIFITVDHGQEPVLSEGSHRRDAAVELGHPDIPAEVRYFGHAEQQGTVEERARHRTAGLYHWAPKDARDSIEQHGLDHRFGPARSEPQGIFFHHDLDRARDWVPGIEKTHDLYEVDGHGLPVHPDPYDTDDASYTSQPVPPERIRRLAREEGAMKESPEETLGPVREASPEEFAHHFGKALEGNPYSYHLTHHNHTSITEGNMKPLTALNGRVGVLVHDHGDGRVEATGLYNRSGVKSAGSAMLKHAMDHHGVNYVEAFGPHLPKVYEKLGFQTHEQYPFDRSLAHPNWDYHRFGEPEYHTMHLNGRKEAAMGSPNEMNWDDPEWVAAERARIEAALLAEHGPEWFEAHRATLDENWNAALAQIGAL